MGMVSVAWPGRERDGLIDRGELVSGRTACVRCSEVDCDRAFRGVAARRVGSRERDVELARLLADVRARYLDFDVLMSRCRAAQERTALEHFRTGPNRRLGERR